MMYILESVATKIKENFDNGEVSYSGNVGGFFFNLVDGYGDKGKMSLDIAQLDGELIQRITLIRNIKRVQIGNSKITFINENEIITTIPIVDIVPDGFADIGCTELLCPKCNKKINMEKVKSFKMIKTHGLSCTYDIKCPSCGAECKYTEDMVCVRKDIEVKG